MLATACTQQQKKPTIARTVGCSRWHFMSAAHAPVVQNCKIANTSLGQQITPSVLVGQQSVSKGLARTIRLKVYTVHIRYFLAGKLPYIRSYTVYIRYFLAGKSPYIRSYTVCIYGSGQPLYLRYILKIYGAARLIYMPLTHATLTPKHYLRTLNVDSQQSCNIKGCWVLCETKT